MKRWTLLWLFAAALVTAGCGGGGGSAESQDASIALALEMINTDTTETSDMWPEERTGSAALSAPEEAEIVDIGA